MPTAELARALADDHAMRDIASEIDHSQLQIVGAFLVANHAQAIANAIVDAPPAAKGALTAFPAIAKELAKSHAQAIAEAIVDPPANGAPAASAAIATALLANNNAGAIASAIASAIVDHNAASDAIAAALASKLANNHEGA